MSRYTYWKPAEDASASVPLGNGDIALNAWVAPSGAVCAYVGKSDSWGEFGQLYKVGRFGLRLLDRDGNPVLLGQNFSWSLDLPSGSLTLRSDAGWLRLYVDANNPCIRITAKLPPGCRAVFSLEPWRLEKRELQGQEQHGLHMRAPYPVWHGKDTLPELSGGQIACFHHNEASCWKANLERQGLGDLANEEDDPLLGRTFGLLARGAGAARESVQALCIENAATVEWTVAVLTSVASSPGQWVDAAQKLADQCVQVEPEAAWRAHLKWWEAFWQRSHIRIDGNEAGRKVAAGYEVQRYLNACAGRGAYPIKFNGSLFTVDWGVPGERFDADYRRWGPGYWHQNTRLPYWAMLYAGDFDLMRPFFRMYRQALPLARERCRKFCHHEGAFFPETMTFWGSYLEYNYGWDNHPAEDPSGNLRRDPDLRGHLPQNQYIRRHFSGSLEVVFLAVLFYRFTGDDDFLTDTALPLAHAVLQFYDQHFPRRNGRMHIHPAQVIEQWWRAENPLPEIAGLRACVRALLGLPPEMIGTPLRSLCQRLQKELPEIPTRAGADGRYFSPAEVWDAKPRNQENPELYAVFPYLHCPPGTEAAEIGRRSFKARTYTHDIGWAQDGMQAALLGLTEAARDSVIQRLTTPSPYARFPGFWGPGWDWIPDQDQGGSAAHALQLMALQAYENTVFPLPAWPGEWQADVRLHGPYRSCIKIQSVFGKQPNLELDGNTEKISVMKVSQ